ncbi:glycine betaine ABC transporter substrate-binding protein [Sulfitobacter sp.]|uniref:glycine betaine ABC transporter substrate-binding protein n=1 Tax=Sulfitobacter sp. TaxID=1903071 RepID=UPI003002E48B
MGKPLVIGQISLSFHTAAAAVVAELLEQLGHDVVLREAPHEAMYGLMQAGDVDLVVSAWLPDSHGVYLEPFRNEIEFLSVIYEPYCIWGIPADAPAEITCVSDLAKPDVASLFRKRIQGIAPGAGISRFSRQMVESYGLAPFGFHFENGTLDDCTNAYLDAMAADELSIMPLWHPQWVHTERPPRELSDPMGLLGGQDNATLVLRKDAMHKISAQGLNMLRKIYFGNETMSGLDHDICRKGMTPQEAARAYLTRAPERVRGWQKDGADV